MSGTYTAGPWFADTNAYGVNFVHGGPLINNGITEYRALVCGGNDHDTLTEADARLIAAAPELLEALSWFINDIDGTHTVMLEFDANVERARAAINKALGK